MTLQTGNEPLTLSRFVYEETGYPLEVQTEVHTSDPTMAGIWDIWREMLRNNCTTCVEADTDPRSECHAWGSLALYEPPSVILC